MTMTADDLVAEARRTVDTITPADAHGFLILDVREHGELNSSGAIRDAIHIPRGLLEFKVDPRSDSAEAALARAHARGEQVNVLCASGGRAALAAATLTRMGYRAAVIEGGLKAWKAADLPVA
ncbi:rhodanese-like domain-containing protein [Breoghania sp. L-A4]|uniref:rhodanese-like domain-containing protein n=1 Tax=Breoghania sp. L-A4 TaxID=2304600 RepID=UPI000E35DD4D|nr:rhodanese-like domain-containing protein [Breoghania sp. L-A4]AXS40860.1 sulfurtransferase [Breoghania sp. L-A4]